MGNTQAETGFGDDLYREQWKLCAGPLVDIPHVEERVYYFPQGHIEQLQASTNQELNQQIPHFNLPSKILCRVMHIQLLAEQETDEVYARITLLPESDDMSQQTPTQELAAKDLHGFEWKFKHIFRGQPRRHLLTTGWSTFVTSKRLVAGDAFVFLRGENGELRVGVRRLARHQSLMPSSVISSQSMHLGVLATASHAVMTRTMFVVYFKPRTSQFIIGLNKYLEAVNNKFSVGMRFKMRFEVEDSPERRFSGTIVGVGDVCAEWSNSPWRSLKVQWDEPATVPRPERVSSWELEPFVTSTVTVAQPVVKSKRSRPIDVQSSEVTLNSPTSTFWYQGSSLSHEPTQLGGVGEVQSNENNVVWSLRQKEINGNSTNTNSSTSRVRTEGIWPSTPNLNPSSNYFSDLQNNKSVAATKSPNVSCPPPSSRPNDGLIHDQIENGREIEKRADIWVFGVNLSSNSTNVALQEKELGSIAIIPSGPKESFPIAPCETENGQNLNSSLSNKEQKQIISGTPLNEKQNKQASIPSLRTRTKVQMQGVAVGRAVDLTMLNDYDDLVDELEKLFDIKGELRSQKWEITYTDDENDQMQVGDDQWPEFCTMVKRIFIISKEDVKKIKSKDYATSSELEETLLSTDFTE
ncbi:unnamed protein product [Lupinus luteus]|uniref:Auxin response factor n=1 Tax=Lupinus luteus TaxID=3873 RepID=A0AAV1VYY0_LUPLU